MEEILPTLPRQFSSYEDELEQARVLRGSTKKGQWTNDAKDASVSKLALAALPAAHQFTIPVAQLGSTVGMGL